MKAKRFFTLIELIVVIAIIAILAAIIAPNAFKAIEKAKISRAITQMKAVKTAFLAYYVDTGQWPPDDNGCDSSGIVNPLIYDLGVEGWDGPYVDGSFVHPWSGAIAWYCVDNKPNWDNESGCWLYLDDDRPCTLWNNNQAMIPEVSLLRIDELVDDGNLSNGEIRELSGLAGELYYKIND